MTKKQRKAESAAGVVADDSCSEEEAGVVIDAAAVPPMRESWELVEFKIFVHYGPPIGAACRHELAFVASARGGMDAVELPCDGGGGEVADRPAKSQLEEKKKKLHFNRKHKKENKDPCSPEGEIIFVSPKLTFASKAVRGELRGIKREMFSMNYQYSLTFAFSMATKSHAHQAIVVDVEEYRLHMKEQFLAHRARQPCAPVQPGAYIRCPKHVETS
jgi:hypothetical protein